MKRQINCTVDIQDYSTFQKNYPQCLSVFVRKAIWLAINDKRFFDYVFFSKKEF